MADLGRLDLSGAKLYMTLQRLARPVQSSKEAPQKTGEIGEWFDETRRLARRQNGRGDYECRANGHDGTKTNLWTPDS